MATLLVRAWFLSRVSVRYLSDRRIKREGRGNGERKRGRESEKSERQVVRLAEESEGSGERVREIDDR